MTTVRPAVGVEAVPGAVKAAGLRVWGPRAALWGWGRGGGAAVLFGSFAAGVVSWGLAWGTARGLAMLGFAFLTHVASAVDVVRQSAFPGPGRWATLTGVSGGLGVGV